MKRVPLAQLKKILRVGDYIGANIDTFQTVYSIGEDCFTVANHRGQFNYYWKSEVFKSGLFWLPSELLDPQWVDPIKRARLKEQDNG